MSRLESFIRRAQAQRDCLNAAARLIAGTPGCVLELGLGNGRTYDHLRSVLADREIHAFDRQLAAHPNCVPPPQCLHLGELADTLAALRNRIGRSAALAHMDLGTGDEAHSRAQSQMLVAPVLAVLAERAVVLSDQPLVHEALHPLPLPEGVPEQRYFIYRHGAAG